MPTLHASKVEVNSIELGIGENDKVIAVGKDDPYQAEIEIYGARNKVTLGIYADKLDEVITALVLERDRINNA